MSRLGVTAHGGPCGPLQFDRLGSRPWPPLIAPLGNERQASKPPPPSVLYSEAKNYGKAQRGYRRRFGRPGWGGSDGAIAYSCRQADQAKAAPRRRRHRKSREYRGEKAHWPKTQSPAKPKGGQIVHFAFGAGMGALYGLLAERFSPVTVGSGALFGVAVYAGAHGLAVPALDLAPSPLKNAPAQEGTELVSHLAYGMVTDAVRRVLTKVGSR
jgi:putative membrane protein